MRFQKFSFGSIRIEGVTYEYDVVIDRGDVRKRKKKPSKKFRNEFGHTPVSIEREDPLEMSSSHHWHWNGSVARDGRLEKRSETSQDRIGRASNHRRHRRAEKEA